jgi:hypothetical protein
VESKEGIFVGNRNLMGALQAANERVPRFQEGGFLGGVQHLKKGGFAQPMLMGPKGPLRDIGRQAIQRVFEGAKNFLADHKHQFAGSIPSGSVRGWLTEALKITGHFSPANLTALFGRAMQESGGNPRAVNNWDSNAAAGHPSQGLLQTIPETFNQYKLKGHGHILNPVDNAIAAIRYMFARYGHIVGPSSSGYMRGGLVKATGSLKGLITGGPVDSTLKHLAGGGMAANAYAAWNGVGPAGLQSGIRNLADYVMDKFSGLQVTSTTGGDHASDSYHYKGQAVDIASGDYGYMDQAAAWIKSSGLYKALVEGIHNPNLSVEAGDLVDPNYWGSETWADHADHIHLAVDRPWTAAAMGDGSASAPGAAESRSSAPKPIAKKVPFKVQGGSTDMGGGTNAPTSGEVPTAPLSFGPIPTTLKEVRKELGERRSQLFQYQHALRAAKKNKEGRVVKALEINIAKLRDRIRKLRRQQFVLAVQNRIGKKGKLPKSEAAVDGAKLAYEQLSEKAEQVMALEPEEGPQAAEYIRGQETPAWGQVFGAVGTWRNAILGGEEAATTRLAKLQAQIEAIKALRVTHPKAWKKRRFEIPALRKAMAQVRELFNPGPPPSGSLEENLAEVQGPGHSREKGPLPTDPTPGAFGGIVWDTQLQIRELGINLKQALESGSESASDSERASLLEQLLSEERGRSRLREVEERVFGAMPPYAGKAHQGAIIPGPRGAERTMIVQAGEGIIPEDKVRALRELSESSPSTGSSDGQIRVLVHGNIVSAHPDPVQVLLGDKRLDAKIEEVNRRGGRREARGAGRSLARAGVFGA